MFKTRKYTMLLMLLSNLNIHTYIQEHRHTHRHMFGRECKCFLPAETACRDIHEMSASGSLPTRYDIVGEVLCNIVGMSHHNSSFFEPKFRRSHGSCKVRALSMVLRVRKHTPHASWRCPTLAACVCKQVLVCSTPLRHLLQTHVLVQVSCNQYAMP